MRTDMDTSSSAVSRQLSASSQTCQAADGLAAKSCGVAGVTPPREKRDRGEKENARTFGEKSWVIPISGKRRIGFTTERTEKDWAKAEAAADLHGFPRIGNRQKTKCIRVCANSTTRTAGVPAESKAEAAADFNGFTRIESDKLNPRLAPNSGARPGAQASVF